MDTLVLGKPNKDSGNRDEFPTFRYQLLNYLGAIDPRLKDAVSTAGSHNNIITLAEMGEYNKKYAQHDELHPVAASRWKRTHARDELRSW